MTAWGGRGAAGGGITEPLAQALNRFDGAGDQIRSRYVGRDPVVRILQLAAACRENVLLLGRPGTAKTDLVASFGRQLENAVVFHALLSRFTEPAELFGPVDVPAFRDGAYRVKTDGMLPEAHFAILDEVFQGSGAILNTLLSMLAERRFHNGAARAADGTPGQPVPLVVLVGTANDLPSDSGLAAFTDRFLLRVRVAPVAADHFDELLRKGAVIEQERLTRIGEAGGPGGTGGFGGGRGRAHRANRAPGFTLADLNLITESVAEVDAAPVHDTYRALVHDLLRKGVELSDRRIVLGLKVVRAAALLDRRLLARPADLWPLAHLWTDEGDEPLVVQAVRAAVAEDPAGAVPNGASTRELLLEANYVFEQFQERADYAPGAVHAALNKLNKLRRTLEDHHPTAFEERNQITELSHKVQEYYGYGGPGPGAPNPSGPGSP